MNRYSVELAENGQQALDALTANPDQYESILVDRMMPDMNGLEVLQQIKSHPSHRRADAHRNQMGWLT